MPTITEPSPNDAERRATDLLIARAVGAIDRSLLRIEKDTDRAEFEALLLRCERRGRGQVA